MQKNKELISDEISEEIVRIAADIATSDGPKNVTVRRIITKLGVTNRVFYNRYHNINEVLEIVYRQSVIRMRESIKDSPYDVKKDFCAYVMDIAIKVLINTYDVKKRFSQFAFEFDSHTDENYRWWTSEIKHIIEAAKATGQIKDIEADKLSYTVWCFIRGYNADVVNRNLSKEEAVDKFKFGLTCLLDGVMKK